MLDRQRSLDQTCDARSTFGVSNDRLNAANIQRILRRAALALPEKGRRDCLSLELESALVSKRTLLYAFNTYFLGIACGRPGTCR